MKFTSINISNNDHKFKYIIEYNDNEEYVDDSCFYTINDDVINFYEEEDDCWIKNNSVFTKINKEDLNKKYDYIPKYINVSSINLYFPEYSIETYERGIKYALTINTWINNKIIYLGTYIINRSDSEAADTIKKIYNNTYYEKVNVRFIDPWFLNYSDDWKDWRYIVCDSKIENNIELNNNGSILNFTLHAVVEQDGRYIVFDKYIGGQNSINLKDNVENNLKYNISLNHSTYGMYFDGQISFNKVYEQNINGFKEYLKETYDIDNFNIQFEFYIQDNTDLYDYFVIDKQDISCRLNKSQINREYPEEYRYTSWDEYIDGMYINSTINILDENGDAIITVMSNEIPLTQEVYKYMIFTGENNLSKIKLNLIDMNVININTVNKIQKNIVQLDRPKDYKSNITKPVYYRVRELSHLVVHPAVTENICLNLDKYKYLADSFILKIEGINFVEHSRTSNGVIFKIIGNKLPNATQNGTYYILNQDSELISTGKYTYEV